MDCSTASKLFNIGWPQSSTAGGVGGNGTDGVAEVIIAGGIACGIVEADDVGGRTASVTGSATVDDTITGARREREEASGMVECLRESSNWSASNDGSSTRIPICTAISA